MWLLLLCRQEGERTPGDDEEDLDVVVGGGGVVVVGGGGGGGVGKPSACVRKSPSLV